MAKCKWCKKSGWMLTVNRYGFCKDCDHEIREKIKGLLAQVQKTVTCTRQAPDRQMLEQLTPQIKQSLEIIRILEEMRPQVPFFRSSTAEYEKALTLGLERAAGKAPLPAAQKPGQSALENAVAAVWAVETGVGRHAGQRRKTTEHLIFPLTVGEKVPSYFYDGIPFLPAVLEGKPIFPHPFEEVLFEQEPENTFDPDTVSVYKAGERIGILPPGPIRELVNSYLDRDLPVMARASVQEGTAALEICFYHEPRKSGFRFFRLRRLEGEQIQKNLSISSQWEKVFFQWKPQEQQFAVMARSGRELGYLPPEAEALLEAGEPFAFLYQVTNADGKKYEATVAIERPRRLWQR